jgi:pimeloyl-ACP methyl ester carboxylesterase
MGRSLRGTNPEEVGWPADPALGLDHLLPLMFCNDMDQDERAAFLAKLGEDDWPAISETDWRYEAAWALPSTYVICLDDVALPPIWQARFADRFGATRRISVQAGHQVMNTRPQALAELLRAEARL